MSTQPTTAKAGSIPDMGALVVHSDVPQALSLQSQQQIAQPWGEGSDFIPASKVAWPLGISSIFSPTSACGQRAGSWALPDIVKSCWAS